MRPGARGHPDREVSARSRRRPVRRRSPRCSVDTVPRHRRPGRSGRSGGCLEAPRRPASPVDRSRCEGRTRASAGRTTARARVARTRSAAAPPPPSRRRRTSGPRHHIGRCPAPRSVAPRRLVRQTAASPLRCAPAMRQERSCDAATNRRSSPVTARQPRHRSPNLYRGMVPSRAPGAAPSHLRRPRPHCWRHRRPPPVSRPRWSRPRWSVAVSSRPSAPPPSPWRRSRVARPRGPTSRR
jgi:hypothetical protein